MIVRSDFNSNIAWVWHVRKVPVLRLAAGSSGASLTIENTGTLITITKIAPCDLHKDALINAYGYLLDWIVTVSIEY